MRGIKIKNEEYCSTERRWNGGGKCCVVMVKVTFVCKGPDLTVVFPFRNDGAAVI